VFNSLFVLYLENTKKIYFLYRNLKEYKEEFQSPAEVNLEGDLQSKKSQTNN